MGSARSEPSATRSSYRSDIISSILSSGCNDKKPGSRGMIWRTPNAVGKLTHRTPKVDRTTSFASPRVPRSSRATIKSASQAAPSCNDGPFGSELTTKMTSTGSCDKNGLNSMAEQLRKPPNVAGSTDVSSGDSFSSQVMGMVSAFWASHQRNKLLMLATPLIAVVGATAYAQIKLNAWNEPFYNALAHKDLPSLLSSSASSQGWLAFCLSSTWPKCGSIKRPR